MYCRRPSSIKKDRCDNVVVVSIRFNKTTAQNAGRHEFNTDLQPGKCLSASSSLLVLSTLVAFLPCSPSSLSSLVVVDVVDTVAVVEALAGATSAVCWLLFKLQYPGLD